MQLERWAHRPRICIAPIYIRRWKKKRNSAQSPQVEGIQLFAQRLGQMYSFKAIACYSNLLLITASYIRSCHFLFVVRSFQNRDNLFHVRFVSWMRCGTSLPRSMVLPILKILVNGKDYPIYYGNEKMFETTNQVWLRFFPTITNHHYLRALF